MAAAAKVAGSMAVVGSLVARGQAVAAADRAMSVEVTTEKEGMGVAVRAAAAEVAAVVEVAVEAVAEQGRGWRSLSNQHRAGTTQTLSRARRHRSPRPKTTGKHRSR